MRPRAPGARGLLDGGFEGSEELRSEFGKFGLFLEGANAFRVFLLEFS